MTTQNTNQQQNRFLRRSDAAEYVRTRFGFPCSKQWLAKLATTGGGPSYRKASRFPVYAIEDLDAWAQARLSAPMRATGLLADKGGENV